MAKLSLTFDTLKKWTVEARKAQAEWRDQADEDFAFVDGHQWNDEEKADLEETSRVPLVFNRVAVVLAAVAGSEINNRTEVRFIPREVGDSKPNEILSAGAEWFRDQASAEDEDSAAFQDMLICGLGWTEVSLDFEADQEGEPDAKRIDPTEMFWDGRAHRKGLDDKRFAGRVQKMDREEAKERFEGVELRDIDCSRWLSKSTVSDGDMSKTVDHAGDEYAAEKDEAEIDEPDTVQVVQIQCWERKKLVEFADPLTGDRVEMEKARFDKLTKETGQNVQHRVLTKRVWYQAFLGANAIIDQNTPDDEACTFVPVTGHWDRKKKRFYGLLRCMVDPQKYANKWFSQIQHIIAANAKGGVMAEKSAVENPRDFEDSWAASDSVTWLEDGGLGRVEEKPKVEIPVALMSLTEFAISSIRDTSGVNMELLGLRDANQPGVLEYQRKQAAMTTLAGYFDALKYYRHMQGKVILHYLVKHIAPTGRLVRIIKEGQAQYVPMALDDTTIKYDVITDDAPSAPNEKEKAWSVIESMMPLLQEAGLSLDDWADIMEYSPLPTSFVEKVRAKAEEQRNNQQEQDPMEKIQLLLEQLKAEKMTSEIEENKQEALLDQTRVAQIQQDMQLAPLEAQASIAGQMIRGGAPA